MLQVRLMINPSKKLLKSRLVLNSMKKYLSGSNKISNKQFKSLILKRYLATEPTIPPVGGRQSSNPINESTPKSYSLRFLLLSLFTVGLTTGLFMGYLTNLNDQYYTNRSRRILILSHPNPVPINHGEPKEIEHPNSIYSKFPLQITLYQYETSPLSAQIRAYLDYFGFNYDLIEVDPYSKMEVKSFEKNPHVPICVFQDRNTDRHWFLYDSPTIMSALETLRTENYSDFYRLIPRYLPIVVHLDELQQDLRYPNRYTVGDNSDLNDPDARKWINSTVIPVFQWNSSDTKQHAAETVDMYADRCHWKDRFGAFKRWYMKNVYKDALLSRSQEFKNEILYLNPSKYSNPMDAVHDVVTRWEHVIDDDQSKPFHGHGVPDLADISMFGAISAFEGCELFGEALNYHKKFNNWFNQMEDYIQTSYGGTKFVPRQRLDWLKLKDDAMKKVKSISDDVKQGASSFVDKVKSGIGMATGAASTVKHTTEDIVDKGKVAAEHGRDKIEDTVNTVYGKASETVEKAKEKAEDAYNTVTGKTSQVFDKAKGKVEDKTGKSDSLYERGKQNLLETLESSAEKATTKTDRRGDLRQRILETSSSLFAPTGEQPEEPYLDPELDLDVKSREAFGLLSGKATDMAKTMQYKGKRRLEKAGEKVNEVIEDAKETVADSVQGIKDEASYVVDKTKEKIGKFADIVQEEARSFVGTFEEKSKDAVEDADKAFEKVKDAAKRLSEHAGKKQKNKGKYIYIDSDETDDDADKGHKNKDLKPFRVLAFSYLSLLAAFSYAAAAASSSTKS